MEGLNDMEFEVATQEFDLLSANLDTPVNAEVEVPYPPSTLSEPERKIYDLWLLQVAHARARGSLNRD